VIQLHDKSFETFITEKEISQEIKSLASAINAEYVGKKVIFVAVLNGAFMFASDLMKEISIECEITFVKVSSYHGMGSTGRVDELIGLNKKLANCNVIIIEDIVDTGITMDKIHKIIELENPASIKICTLLYKPSAHTGNHKPDFVGFSIPNAFVVGYGLDYNELGRNLNQIYQVKETKIRRKMLNIVLFGPPGAGKGTQSERIIAKYGLTHLSTGDIFRANIKGETELGILAKNFMDKGQLVPDEITINMLKSEVQKIENPKGFIFDGFPRTNVQAVALDKFLQEEGTAINKLFALDVEIDELKARLKNRAEVSGRIDDANPLVIQKRIDVYLAETMPVKAYYQEQNKFTKINGHGTMDEITSRLFAELDQL
jgi:adenylate kinase